MKAERDFWEYFGKETLGERDATASACRNVDGSKDTPTRSSEEPVRVYVAGYMPQRSAPYYNVAQQLQTPPNTLIGFKRERPISWEADHVSKGAIPVGDDGALEAATGLDRERTHFHITSHTTQSAKLSICHADDCSIEDSSSASEPSLSPTCSDMVANDTSTDDENSSSSNFGSTSSEEGSTSGYTGEEVAIRRQVLHATDGDDKSNVSTILFDDCSIETSFTGKDIHYPRLPLLGSSGRAKIIESTTNDRNVGADLDLAPDHFGPDLDYIPLGTSSDHDNFNDDPAVLERISTNGPRIEPRLCDEQLALVDLILSGQNVFYTGSAGCGKSTVLKHFIPVLRKEGKKVDVLAPTGRAALEVNGRTLHNYAGWVPRSLGQPLGKLEINARGKKVWKRLMATDVLVIDEISMVANHVFERLNCVMKAARGSEKPFGGVQVVVTGDFCQLPPVNAFEYCLTCGTTLDFLFGKSKYECTKCFEQYSDTEKWAFCSAAWRTCNFEHVNLKAIHRQKDAKLKAILAKCRLGEPFSVDEKWLLLEHESETKNAVRLFPRRKDVKAINEEELAKLPGRPLTYLCLDNFWWNPDHENLSDKGDHCSEPLGHALEALKEHSFEPRLVLKEGMLVILLVNWDLDSSLANGSQGTIVGFEKHDPKLFPEVPRDWDYSSRRNGLIKVFVNRTAVQEWPIVQFLNGKRRTIYPRCLMNELGDDKPYSLLSRTQIPLMAAWAMTVHKAQGMTLSRVIVDLKHAFEPGHEYVALSRAETLGGLKVEGLSRDESGPNKQVIGFLKQYNLVPSIESGEYSEEESPQV